MHAFKIQGCHKILFKSNLAHDLTRSKKRFNLLMLLYFSAYFSVIYTVLYCIVLYCTVLYCTVLYCTVLYCTVLYCTVPVLDSVWHDDTASSIIKLCRCRQSKVFNADKNVFIIHQLIVNTGIFNQKDVSQFQKLVSVIEIIYLL